MLAFSYNAQDLYTALTEIAKFRTKDKTLPILQDIMITLDKDAAGMWLTATDRFKVLSAYIGETREWKPLPEHSAVHGISPTQLQVILAHLKGMGVAGRKRSTVHIAVVDEERNTLSWGIITEETGAVEIYLADPSELSYPQLRQLVNPVVELETHTLVSLEHFGGAKFLGMAFSAEQTPGRPQLIKAVEGRTNIPFIGLVMPIRLP